MIKNEFTFLSSDKKTNIHAMTCVPKDNKYTKILQILHGMREHIERYMEFMEYLTSQGYMVVCHDYLGHGNSYVNKDDRGYFGEPDPLYLLIQDIHHLRTITQEKNPNIPYFMLGHSFGSFLLRSYITKYGENLAGAIVMGTGFHNPCIVRMGILALRCFACLKGWRHKSPYVKKFTEGKEMEKYDLTGKDPTNGWWSRDPEHVKRIINDPKSDFIFSLNGYLAVFQSILTCCDANNVAKMKKELPILLVSGKCDIIGGYGKTVQQCYELLKSVGSVDVTLKFFEDDRHEILHELDKEQVFEYIKNWMETKTKIV